MRKQYQKILFQQFFQHQQMKAPAPKIVSHLNLKFLDLKILSVQNDSNLKTLAIPKLDHFIRQKSIQKSIAMSKNPSGHTLLYDNQTQYEQRNNSKMGSKYQEYTNDITHGQSIITLENGEVDTENMLKYLSADSNTIYREIDRAKGLQSIHIKKHDSETSKLPRKTSPGIDYKINRYETQITKIQRQNQLIHDQIVKMYSSKYGQKGLKVKNVRNMKILQQIKPNQTSDKHFTLDNTENQVEGNYRYRTQDKKNQLLAKKQLDNFKNSHELVGDKLKQFNSIERSIQKINKAKSYRFLNSFKVKGLQKQANSSSSRKLAKKKLNQFHLPSLIRNKYENFYENLYKEQNQKSILETEDGQADKLNELKKKMVNNNLDKNFESFLIDRKMRVPEFLKKLR